MAKNVDSLKTLLIKIREQFDVVRSLRIDEQNGLEASDGIKLVGSIGRGARATGVPSNCEVLAATALKYWGLMKSLEDPEKRTKAMMKCGWLLHSITESLRGQPKEFVQRELAGVSKEMAEMARDVLPTYVKVLPLFRNQN